MNNRAGTNPHTWFDLELRVAEISATLLSLVALRLPFQNHAVPPFLLTALPPDQFFQLFQNSQVNAPNFKLSLPQFFINQRPQVLFTETRQLSAIDKECRRLRNAKTFSVDNYEE
jgi:hypothetical protein